MKPFALTHEDRQSPLWRKLLAHWQGKLEILRAQNDGDKDEKETAHLRGRIAELKATLALNDEPRNIE